MSQFPSPFQNHFIYFYHIHSILYFQMLKKELEEISQVEQFLDKMNSEDQIISQLKEQFYHNSEFYMKGQLQTKEDKILNDPSPEEKLMQFLKPIAQNSYEELEQIENHITMMQKGVKDFDRIRNKYVQDRSSIVKSGLKTDCVQAISDELGDKNISNPNLQLLLGKFEKEGESKNLWMFLDEAFEELEKMREEDIPKVKGKKVIEIGPLLKSKLKNLVTLFQNMDEILPAEEQLN